MTPPAANTVLVDKGDATDTQSAAASRIGIDDIAASIWASGISLMLGYAIYGYIRLSRRLRTAVRVCGHIYETDRISTAFVIGFIRPKIYLPIGLPAAQREYILAHEQTHIRRRDYLIKPFGFLALTVHWFNPVIWLAYYLMTQDMEMSCDESVLTGSGSRFLAEDIRTGYSGSLLMLSERRSGLFMPLAFGEGNVRTRIRNILRYRKPKMWRAAAAAALIVVVTAGCAFTRDSASEPIPDVTDASDISPTPEDTTMSDTGDTFTDAIEPTEPTEPEIDPVVQKYYDYFVTHHTLVDNRIFTVNDNTLQDDLIYFAFKNTEPTDGMAYNVRTKAQIDDVLMKYFGIKPKRYNTGTSSVTGDGNVQLGSVITDVVQTNRLLLKELVDNGDGSLSAVFKLYQLQASAVSSDVDRAILTGSADIEVYYIMDLRTTFTEQPEGDSYYLKFSEFTLEPREGAFTPPAQETDYTKKVSTDEIVSYHGLSIGMTLDAAKTLLNLTEDSYSSSEDDYAAYTTVSVDGWSYTFRTLPKTESSDKTQYLMAMNIRDYLGVLFRDIKLGDAYEDVIKKFPSGAEEGQIIGAADSYFTRDYRFASTLHNVDIFVDNVHLSMLFGKYDTLAWADIYSTDY
jgi:beta-lactamase regulating signal transducer with metallopeptidase domain